jgi:hypothetical protein
MYIFLRVILSIVTRLSKDSLGEALGTKLEDMLWRYVTVSRESYVHLWLIFMHASFLLIVLVIMMTVRSETY